MADLYVMPSVSEPFGITPLEALKHNVPVLISKQSGIAEVLIHALKVDFWDIDQMANKIAAVLKFPLLRRTLREAGHREVREFCWEDAAAKIKGIYEKILNGS
jgi:glycosyltransferase involved in cell wall biosynthesis